MTESGMVSSNSSLQTDPNMFNVDTDGLSLCSDVSLPSSEDDVSDYSVCVEGMP